MTPLARQVALAVCAAVSTSACGPRRLVEPAGSDGSQGSGSAGDGSGGTDHGVDSTSSPDGGTTVDVPDSPDESGTTQGEICEAPAFPDDPATNVLLRIENDSAAPIFLRGPDCYHELFAVEPPDGVVGEVTWSCNLTCADAVAGGFCTCEGCPSAFTRIEPGVQYAAQWRGRLFASLELPPCAGCAQLDSCQTPFTAPPGTYRLSVEIFAPLPDCGAACECRLPGQAHCVLQQPALEPKPATFSIDIEHPNQPDVLILVQ